MVQTEHKAKDAAAAAKPMQGRFAELVREELAKVRSKHGRIHSLHEGYAVILEEVDELWEEVRKRRSQRNEEHIVEELVQIAAACQRTGEDLVPWVW